MEHKIKTAVTAVTTAIIGTLSAWIGILAIPLTVLIGLNLADYITGLCAAQYRNQKINSYKSFRGIAKKICMWLLVGVGAVMDWLVLFATESVGITLQLNFYVSCIVAAWLICNEIISILENISDIGAPIPPILISLVKMIKTETEKKGIKEKDD